MFHRMFFKFLRALLVDMTAISPNHVLAFKTICLGNLLGKKFIINEWIFTTCFTDACRSCTNTELEIRLRKRLPPQYISLSLIASYLRRRSIVQPQLGRSGEGHPHPMSAAADGGSAATAFFICDAPPPLLGCLEKVRNGVMFHETFFQFRDLTWK